MNDIIVHRSDSDSIVEIVLNRPHRRNAVTGPMVEELISTFENLNSDPTVSVIVLRGADGAFCSGLDLKEFGSTPPPDWARTFPERWQHLHGLLFDSPKILLGAIEGAAINAGSALALACDVIIVGPSSKLLVGEIQRGMAAPMNLAWLSLRHSESVAARLALVGEPVDGPALAEMGVAHQCVEDSLVVQRCHELATRLAKYDLAGTMSMKKALRRTYFNGTSKQWFGKGQD
jgi:enoyl-CoA hydratase/carnithine racemase